MKKQQRGFAAVEALIIIVILVIVSAIGWYVFGRNKKSTNEASTTSGSTAASKTSAVQPTNEAPSIKLPKGKSQAVRQDQYYSVTLAGNHTYYGKLQKINDQYVRLYPAFYYNTKNLSQLVRLGAELHAPEGAMYIQLSQLTQMTELSQQDKVVTGMKALPAQTLHDAFPKRTIDSYLKTNQYQAVFFANGTTYFGKLSSLSTPPLFKDTNDVYTLKNNSDQISLVLVPAATVEQRSAAQVVFWENLQNGGQVTKAIVAFNQGR